MDNKRFTDETTQIKVITKGKKRLIVEDEKEDYSDLQKTREFKSVFLRNGNPIVRHNPSIREGLDSDKVDQRIKDGLTNKCKDKNKKTVLGIILKNVFTFLNILLFGIGIVLFSIGSFGNCFFLLIITSNLLIGIYQEIRAKQKIDKLAVLTNVKTTVIRNGFQYDVDADDLVLDDIIVLQNGNKISADAIVKEGLVEVNESLLTGEALPVKKKPGDLLFAGSFVSSGSCYAKVERVGQDSYVSQLQSKVKKYKKNNSQILKTLNKIIRYISIIIIPLSILLFGFSWWKIGFSTDLEQIKQIIETTAGSMVAMIPSGLYLTTSITLFVAMINLARDKALVQDSYSVEALARVDVLCLDKTGTITDGTMRVENHIVYDESVDVETVVYNIMNAFDDRNQTSLAILDHYKTDKKLPILNKLPFSSSRKKSAVEFEGLGSFVIGAPEFVLSMDHPLVKDLEKYTLQGYRVILMGKVSGVTEDDVVGKATPVASFIIKDHIREEAYDTIKWFKENNVEIKIISGDNPLTVSVIAKEVGVENADQYISLEGLTLEEVSQAATKYSVFGRVAPEQKATLIQALKEAGRTVAMTGDGVNDILAMKRADCSIAMASGSEASRNVAQLVLVESNFACMPKIVKEGRRVINNVQAVASLFLMKTIFAIFFTASLHYPFEPRHLYVLEFVVIGIPSFLLALQPNHQLVKGNFFKNVLSKCLPAGFSLIVATAIALLFCKFNLIGCREEMATTLAGLAISIMGIVILGAICYPFNKYRTFVFSMMVLFGFVLLVVCPLINFNLVGYDIFNVNLNEIIVLIISLLIGTVIYFSGKIISNLIVKKHEKTNK